MSTNRHKQTGKKKTWINKRVVFRWNDQVLRYEQIAQEGYWYDGPLALATTPPTYEVTNWAFYNDGTESGATIIGSVNTNPTLDVNTTYHVRFGLEETGGNLGKNTVAQLQYNHNGGGFNNVTTTSSVVRVQDSTNLTDGEDSTQRITAFSFDGTNEGVDDGDGIAGGGTADLTNNGFEAVFSFQIRSADVSDSDTIVLKIVNSADADADFNVYNQTDPTVTVSESAPSITLIDFERGIGRGAGRGIGRGVG